jgi:hypothetical protein
MKTDWYEDTIDSEERIIAIFAVLQSELAVLQGLSRLIEIEVGNHSIHNVTEDGV